MSRFQGTTNTHDSEALPILMGHDLSDEHVVTALSPKVFRNGLQRLKTAGFRTVSLDDVAKALHAGVESGPNQRGTPVAGPFSGKHFAITFDDGSQSVYSQAFPVLQEFGFSATVFLTVGETPGTDPETRLPSRPGRTMLSWGEIREMQQYGIAFGAHTLTHPNLTRLPLDRAETEICSSQAIIANVLGAPVSAFAYPYGFYDEQTRAIVSRHFGCACSVRLGLASPGSDPYALERVDTHYLRTDGLFSLMCQPWFAWYVRARAIPRRIRRGLNWRMG